MKNFREIRLWQKILAISFSGYNNRKKSSKHKFYGLSKQSRRSCASISANIIEGCGKIGETGYNRFLDYTIGSAIEAEYQLQFLNDQNYIKRKEPRPNEATAPACKHKNLAKKQVFTK